MERKKERKANTKEGKNVEGITRKNNEEREVKKNKLCEKNVEVIVL